ncbi:protein-glutamine gamma-glutamyltransferase E-like [Rhinatrema bivittatum]|uniref:protein-glutamine gamma-glutamyltransferase E-like n=1 Tax=Rhinatrema bivittatum TaxID=194408 RepID=UPI00112B589C|nr:protein-glutamine gamma-glutamyltransferase E-like [Rhinatrema bivittatum]XP_029470623.1 protein-glutamine gamma-glutamyltransferase E-like [Rhinatrema bivittatum]XP_029470624.1 protein-glutamine gamma-glutamyltransferase E-like [Rhinatrema bivittatum]XP_029470626.1 protein-glutamine gamma-glutamyltransferase E-like [Rhinatrema bivittatum]XP_029470627.1 protein-glutamine gamma-glutamyltransferase E-like [Rhinatrema bivittatum]XP_029470628.1 protein-glutamine gamma-glutamyltransferase E-like
MQTAFYRPLCQNATVSGTVKLAGPVSVGQDINVKMILKNLSDTVNTSQLNITAHSIIYTRKRMRELLNETRSITFEPNEEKEIPVTIGYCDYEDCLTSDNMIEVRAVCIGQEKGDAVVVHRDIVLDNPKLCFKVTEQAMVNKTMIVEVSFLNPLHKEISEGVLTAEGSGLIKDQVILRVGCVKPQEVLIMPIEITPYRSGTRQLLIDFCCTKFSNVKGFHCIEVAPESMGVK